jgi:hypothetical protein
MATIALLEGKVILRKNKVSCICCGPFCITGNDYFDFGRSPEQKPTDPCSGFFEAKSDAVVVAGMYDCNGNSDDECTVTWSGGSTYFPASNPGAGPCYGRTAWTLNGIELEENEKIICKAGSWAGPCGCDFICCLILAP